MMYHELSGFALCPNGKTYTANTEDKVGLQYQLKDKDMDWRGTGKTYRDTIDEALLKLRYG